MEVAVNYWAVLLATVSSMVVGSVWYAPPVFGDLWMKLAKVDKKQAAKAGFKPIIIAAVVSFFTSYVLAHVAFLSHNFFDNSFLQDSLTTAFFMWFGFVATRAIMHDSFEVRPAQLTALNVAHEFVALMAMGLIIGLMPA